MRPSTVSRNWVLLLLLGAGTAGAADVPTFLIETSSGSRGNSFVVKDWRPGRAGRHLLVTALHVLYRKSDIAVMRVNCASATTARNKAAWVIPNGTPVLTWPRHDLAAIELPNDSSVNLDQVEAGELEFNEPSLERTSFVHVHGSSNVSVCQGGMGFLMGQPVAEKLAQHLVAHFGEAGTGKTFAELTQLARGSIAGNVPLIQYFSPSAPGTSGAAVTLPSRRKAVIGIHNAGYTNSSISWAVAFAGQQSALAQPQAIAHLGQANWPVFTEPRLSQSSSMDVFPEEMQASARRATQYGFIDLVWLIETGERAKILAQAVRGGFTYEVGRYPATHQSIGLGLRIAVGYRWARTRESAFGPDGRPLWERDLWVKGFFFEPEVELRLLRLSQFRPALGISTRISSAKFSLWGSRSDHEGGLLSANLRLYFAPRNNFPVSLLAELRLARGYEVRPVHRYTGIGAQVDTRTEVAVWLPGGAFGVVY